MTMNQDKLIDLTCSLLDCGYLDVEFLLRECDSWNIDIDEAIDEFNEIVSGQKMDCNALIYSVYNRAYYNVLESVYEDNQDGYDIFEHQPFINCIDSHFNVVFDGVTKEFYNVEEFETAIVKMRDAKTLKKQSKIWANVAE